MGTIAQSDVLEAIEVLEPCASAPGQAADRDGSVADLIELLLKDQRQLDQLTRSVSRQRDFVPRLLAIGLAGYVLFGLTLTVAFQLLAVWPTPHSIAAWLRGGEQFPVVFTAEPSLLFWTRWMDGSAPALVIAFAGGPLGALGVCLPSFYFYGLLAGVRTTMLQVTTHALKGLAAGAIALVGLLPVYLAAVLGLAVFDAPHAWVVGACLLGLVLPFLAGLWGSRSLYSAFMSLSDTLPADRRCRRTCFLRRLLIAWSACYTAVAPLMVFTLWEWMIR